MGAGFQIIVTVGVLIENAIATNTITVVKPVRASF
jgi:hypothetical protein